MYTPKRQVQHIAFSKVPNSIIIMFERQPSGSEDKAFIVLKLQKSREIA